MKKILLTPLFLSATLFTAQADDYQQKQDQAVANIPVDLQEVKDIGRIEVEPGIVQVFRLVLLSGGHNMPYSQLYIQWVKKGESVFEPELVKSVPIKEINRGNKGYSYYVGNYKCINENCSKLIIEAYDDREEKVVFTLQLKPNGKYSIKHTKGGVVNFSSKPKGKHISDDFLNEFRPGNSIEFYQAHLGNPIKRYKGLTTYETEDAVVELTEEDGTIVSVRLIPTNQNTASRFHIYGYNGNPYEKMKKGFGTVSVKDFFEEEENGGHPFHEKIYHAWGNQGACANETFISADYARAYGGGSIKIGYVSNDPCDINVLDLPFLLSSQSLMDAGMPYNGWVEGEQADKIYPLVRNVKINYVQFNKY